MYTIYFMLYLIEILHQTTTSSHSVTEILKLYLIEILHQTTTGSNATLVEHGCILSKFYIKPQLLYELILEMNVVSYRNSTSNHNLQPILYSLDKVVSYRNSTSNHNGDADLHHSGRVVSYRNSTSNHNFRRSTSRSPVLYLIEILHQTTTKSGVRRFVNPLYLIEILHQTTTVLLTFFAVR